MGKLLLVGCGKMGGAMLDGWLSRGFAAADVLVAEPVEALRPKKPGLRAVGSTSEVSDTPEIVVLAVKPEGNLGRGRYELRKAELKLAHEFTSM